jgi:hypothetical protein
MTMRRERLIIWLPWLAVMAAALIRILALNAKSLWLDEMATLNIAQGAVSDILTARWDPHPPLYYVLMHFWVKMGQSETMLRLPSALASLASIPLLYALVRLWGGRWSAVAAAWLLALAPLSVWYAFETRMYAMVGLLGLLSTLCYTLARQRGSALAWLGWVIVTLLGLYTDYSMLLVVVGQLAFYKFGTSERGSQLVQVWAMPIMLLMLLLAYEPQARRFLLPILLGGEDVWTYLFEGPAFQITRLGLPLNAVQLHTLVLAAIAAGLLLLVVVATWLPRLPWLRWLQGRWAAPAAVALYLLILVGSAIPRVLGLKRQLLIGLPYVLAAIAAALAFRRSRNRLILVLLLLTLPVTAWVAVSPAQEDWRGAAQTITANQTPADGILVHADYNDRVFQYYYRGGLPVQGVHLPVDEQQIQQLAVPYQRVWLLLAGEKFGDPQEAVQGWFDTHYRLLEMRDLGRLRLRLYGARTS